MRARPHDYFDPTGERHRGTLEAFPSGHLAVSFALAAARHGNHTLYFRPDKT